MKRPHIRTSIAANRLASRERGPHRGRLVCQEAAGQLMHGWLLVLTLINLALANTIVWFAIAQGWP